MDGDFQFSDCNCLLTKSDENVCQ